MHTTAAARRSHHKPPAHRYLNSKTSTPFYTFCICHGHRNFPLPLHFFSVSRAIFESSKKMAGSQQSYSRSVFHDPVPPLLLCLPKQFSKAGAVVKQHQPLPADEDHALSAFVQVKKEYQPVGWSPLFTRQAHEVLSEVRGYAVVLAHGATGATICKGAVKDVQRRVILTVDWIMDVLPIVLELEAHGIAVVIAAHLPQPCGITCMRTSSNWAAQKQLESIQHQCQVGSAAAFQIQNCPRTLA